MCDAEFAILEIEGNPTAVNDIKSEITIGAEPFARQYRRGEAIYGDVAERHVRQMHGGSWQCAYDSLHNHVAARLEAKAGCHIGRNHRSICARVDNESVRALPIDHGIERQPVGHIQESVDHLGRNRIGFLVFVGQRNGWRQGERRCAVG